MRWKPSSHHLLVIKPPQRGQERRVKKSILSLGIAIFMVFAAFGVQAAETRAEKVIANPAGNPIDQLTGKVWQESKESNKQAILFGIDLGVAANYFAEQKARENFAKKGKKQPPRFLSHFDRCWMEAFRDVSRKDAVKMVDDWYAAHPDQLDRPVLGVLWNEVVTPLLNKKQ